LSSRRPVNVRLSEDTIKALDQIAELHPEANRSSVIRKACREIVEDYAEMSDDEAQQELFNLEA
jgi:metal-responsive CopG/Arc/MetJ family transcriptional regulator